MEIFFVFLFGLIIGSFLNSVIYRLEVGGSIARERSRCPKCEHILAWYELVPLLSFAVQLGRCRACGERVSWQYPMVELMTGLLFMLAYRQSPGFILPGANFQFGHTIPFVFNKSLTIYNLQFL